MTRTLIQSYENKKRIAIFAPHHAVGMSIMLIKDLCWSAQQQSAENELVPPIPLLSIDGKPVDCHTGSSISIDGSLEQLDDIDVLFVAAFWGDAKTTLQDNAALLPKLKQFHQQGKTLITLSNAAFYLAEAGLLHNRVATLYPPYAEAFRQRYPSIQLRPERAITVADNLYCANGIASGCDLCISVIEQLHGPEAARKVATRFLIGFSRTYPLWNIAFDGQKYHKDRQILMAQQWLERHYHIPFSLTELAADLGMSMRNFSRRFKDATGDSALYYLQRLRIEAACDQLKNTDLKVIEICNQVGYHDISAFNKRFKKMTSLTPREYRKVHTHTLFRREPV